MKTIALLISLFLLPKSLQAASTLDFHESAWSLDSCVDCQPLGGSLFWAQEYIGGDLAKVVAESVLSARPKIAVWDASFTNEGLSNGHGVKVENLIAGSGRQAVSNSTTLVEFVFDNSDPRVWVEQAVRENDIPALVNVSAFLGESAALGLESLSERGTISVIAAGNDFPVVHAQISSYSHLKQKIVVGSLSPFGLVSGFSEESSLVTVLAPSDFFLTSALKPEDDHHYTGFDGTSGAAPMVTGAIANVLTILPGISFSSINEIIVRTAIPTIALKSSRAKNGAGLINAYYMARAAQRVANECRLASSPLNCAAANLQRVQTYQFASDLALRNELESIPCSVDLNVETMQSLRQEALLHPYDSYLWERLACAKKAQHDEVESGFYHRLALVTSPSDQRLSLETELKRLYERSEISKYKIINSSQKTSVLRALMQLGSAGNNFAKERQTSGDKTERMIANDVLSSLGEKHIDTLTTGLLDPDSEVRQHALSNSLLLGPGVLPILATMFKNADSSSELRVSLVQIICSFGPSALPFLAEATQDPDFMVRYYFVRGLTELGRDAIPYLEVLAKDSNATIRDLASQQLAKMNPKLKM